MDIALNITTNTQQLRSKPEAEKPLLKKPLKSKSKSTTTGGFTFKFGSGTQKVRAVVARKRPINKTLNNNTTNVKTIVATNKTATPETPNISDNVVTPTVKKSIAIKRKATIPSKETTAAPSNVNIDNNDSNDNNINVGSLIKPPIANDLMLNIHVGEPKQKLTKAVPLHEKRNKRRVVVAPAKRVFTQQELRDGLRRFNENPNKIPRAADLYEAKLNELKKNDEAKTEVQQEPTTTAANEPELGKIDSNARKVNSFRVSRPEDRTVKKIGLFGKDHASMKPLGQRLVKPIKERIFDGTKVETLGLHPHAVKNLVDMLSITELTTVQQKTIPKALEGKDLLVRSQTGSGKTLAYALPIVEKLQQIRPKLTRDSGILALIIVPTRELVIQTYELMQKLLKPFTWIVSGSLLGGESRKSEKARLRKGINILIGTPGRLVDHLLHTETFKLSKVKFLVLDEADRLLEMGYERDVKQIVEAIDKQRTTLAEESKTAPEHLQSLLLSATLTAAIQKLAGLTLHEPIFIDNSDQDESAALRDANGYTKETIEAATAELYESEDITGILTIPENLQLNYVVVPPKLRLVTFAALLAKEYVGKQRFKAIVFMSTMEMVNFHHDLLNEALTQKILDEDDEEERAARAVIGDIDEDDDDGEEPLLKGLRFFKLHGSMTQTERQGVFKGFRDNKSGVLLATDVVGRGIDVTDIDLVIQFSPPQKTADFVHRVGRTARAGRVGRALLFLAPNEVEFVRNLEDKRIRISQVDMDVYLNALVVADDDARNIQQAASNLQHKFQELISDDTELHNKACKAFVSWMKFYTTFPRELKPIFNMKNAHMGHFAKSFGLKDTPTSFVNKHSQPKPAPPTNRLTYTERDPEKIKEQRRNRQRLYTTTVSGAERNRKNAGEQKSAGTAFRGQQFNNNNNNNNSDRNMKFNRRVQQSRILNISEFGSGLPELKKR